MIPHIALVPTREIATLWPFVSPLLAPAIAQTNGRETAWSVLAALQKGEKQLWIAFRDDEVLAAVTTSIDVYESGPWLHIGLCGGHGLLRWAKLGLPILEDFARSHDCLGVMVVGRKGWQRVLDVAPTAYQFERMFHVEHSSVNNDTSKAYAT